MIRQVQLSDYENILKIREVLAFNREKLTDNNYRLQIQKVGFLLPYQLTQERFQKDVEKTFLISEHDGKPVGYLRIDEEQEMTPEIKASWFKPELKAIYFSKPHADIGGICILPEYGKHGLATKMLEVAEREVKAKGIEYLFSFVVLSPITNFPSMMFHEKNGFERAAVIEPFNHFGLDNYQSFLYYKNLFPNV